MYHLNSLLCLYFSSVYSKVLKTRQVNVFLVKTQGVNNSKHKYIEIKHFVRIKFVKSHHRSLEIDISASTLITLVLTGNYPFVLTRKTLV